MDRGCISIGAGVGLAILIGSSLHARPAVCVLEVSGLTYIDGPCDFRSLEDGTGSFQITSADQSYFAYLYVEGDGFGSAHWNEIAGASHAHTPLGALTREGACWINNMARLCTTSVP